MENSASFYQNTNIFEFKARANNSTSTPKKPANNLAVLMAQQSRTLTMLQKLQGTLDLNELLTRFYDGLFKIVCLDAFCYENIKHDFHLSTAQARPHQVNYQLHAGKQHLGFINISRRSRFNEDELALIEQMVGCLLLPLKNCLQYHTTMKAAFTDPLTGAGNRQSLENTLTREIAMAQSNGGEISLIMFDFDHFKMINDAYGHRCGDMVLKNISAVVNGLLNK